jgi:hypothetical protein
MSEVHICILHAIDNLDAFDALAALVCRPRRRRNRTDSSTLRARFDQRTLLYLLRFVDSM